MKKIFIILTLLSIPAVWYLIRPGGYEPHDLHHIADIYQMYQAISSGQFPPRLGPDFLYGFGYPLFNYYYVLPFYIGAFFYSAFGSLMAALKAIFLLSALLSVYGMYLFLNKFFSKTASIAGSILYLYTPFRAVEIFVRGAIGEAFAIALFPWLLLGISNLVKKPNEKNISLLAIILSLFLLTHNYFFIFVAPFTALFAAILFYFEKKRLEAIRALVLSGILGVGLSAFWVLPAFLEYGLVSSVTPFVMEDHFPFIKQLIIPSWGYGSSVWGPYDEISFQIGIVNLFAAAAAVPLLSFAKVKSNTKFFVTALSLVFFVGAIFMMNIRSSFIWNAVPFTNFIQFPWRLLAITAFFTALMAAFVTETIRFKKASAVIIVGLSIVLTASYFKPSKVTFNSDEHYIERMFANSEFSEDYLLLPQESKQKPDFVPEHRFYVESGQVVSINEISKVHWEAEISAQEDTIVEAYVLNFPGWFVEVDGQEVSTSPTDPYGHISFNVTEGIHKVELYWSETNLRLLADIISIASLAIVIVLYFRQKASRATI